MQVKTKTARLQGGWDGDIAAFRGVPYAEAPRRFAPPRPLPRSDDLHDARAPAPAPPQLASRLESVMGPIDVPGFDEDCLTLNVWTPAPDSGERLPVFVWIHGGGYLSGSGSAAWYDGTLLARRGRMVVVSLSYRLGALGYLYLPGTANRGLLDQRQALAWLAENVAAFGGDPGNVTVVGQSAGGHAIAGLAALDAPFQRAILQSAPLGMRALEPDEASATTAVFMDAAGATDVEALMRLPVPRILHAQRETLRRTAAPGSLDVPFQLIVDGEVLEADPIAGDLDGIDLLLGCTAHEARGFFAFDDDMWARDHAALAATLHGESARRYERCRRASPRAAAIEPYCDLLGDEHGVMASLRLAERRAAYVYWFTWRSPVAAQGRLAACHTIEIPFVFGNLDAWRDAPMLAGAERDELQPLVDRVQDHWIAFAHTGRPGPGWPPYVPPERATLQLGPSAGMLRDPAGDRRKLWDDDAR